MLRGMCFPDEISKKEEFDLSNIEPNEEGVVSKREVAEIIEARMEEIFSMVKKELKQIEKDGMLPSGIVFTGGGSRLVSLVDLAKREFNLPASVGLPQGFTTAIDKVKDPVFAVAVGLCIWGAKITGKGVSTFGKFSSVGEVTGKMKKWFKNLIP